MPSIQARAVATPPPPAKFRSQSHSVQSPEVEIVRIVHPAPLSTSGSDGVLVAGPSKAFSPSAVVPSAAAEASARKTVVVDLRQSIKALQEAAEPQSKTAQLGIDDDDDDDDDWRMHRKLFKQGHRPVRVRGGICSIRAD